MFQIAQTNRLKFEEKMKQDKIREKEKEKIARVEQIEKDPDLQITLVKCPICSWINVFSCEHIFAGYLSSHC